MHNHGRVAVFNVWLCLINKSRIWILPTTFITSFSCLLLEKPHMKMTCFWICSPTVSILKSEHSEDQSEIRSLLCSKYQWPLILCNVQKDTCSHPLVIITLISGSISHYSPVTLFSNLLRPLLFSECVRNALTSGLDFPLLLFLCPSLSLRSPLACFLSYFCILIFPNCHFNELSQSHSLKEQLISPPPWFPSFFCTLCLIFLITLITAWKKSYLFFFSLIHSNVSFLLKRNFCFFCSQMYFWSLK